MEELISIIVPVYNNIEDIERCLTSIKNQTYSNFECIIVDDGSTDGSGEYLDNFAKSDDRFKVFHKENGGVSSARNYALDRICGEWFTFIDGDDEILPNYLKVLYDAATENGCEYALCEFQPLTEWEQRKDFINSYKPSGEIKVINIDNHLKKEDLSVLRFGSACSQFFKSSILGNKRFLTDVYYTEDIIFDSGMVVDVKRMVFVPEKMYLYKKWGTSSGRSLDAKKRFSRVGRIDIIYKQFKGKNKKLYKYYKYIYTICCYRDITTVAFYDELMKHKKFLVKELRKNVLVYLFGKEEFKTKILYLALCIAPQFVINKLRKKHTND